MSTTVRFYLKNTTSSWNIVMLDDDHIVPEKSEDVKTASQIGGIKSSLRASQFLHVVSNLVTCWEGLKTH